MQYHFIKHHPTSAIANQTMMNPAAAENQTSASLEQLKEPFKTKQTFCERRTSTRTRRRRRRRNYSTSKSIYIFSESISTSWW